MGGAILYEETLRQSTADGVPFVKVLNNLGIKVGIKVDKVFLYIFLITIKYKQSHKYT